MVLLSVMIVSYNFYSKTIDWTKQQHVDTWRNYMQLNKISSIKVYGH